jgi:4-azaleucine resistance transporter AzlC
MRDMLPMSVAAATYGLAFGLLASQSGFDIFQTISMSALVFGGSSQLVAMEQLTVGLGAASAILAGSALNTRILLVTASMRNVLIARSWWQIGLGTFFATDASVALMQSAKTRNMTTSYWYFFGGGASLYAIWIAVTAIGAFVSGGVPNPQAIGLDFAIIAIFVATLPGMWRGTQDILPWLFASSIVLIWGTLFPEYASWGLIGGAVIGAMLAGLKNEY